MATNSSACSRAAQVLKTHGVRPDVRLVRTKPSWRLNRPFASGERVCTSRKDSLTLTHALYAFIAAFILQHLSCGQPSTAVLLPSSAHAIALPQTR